MEGEPCAECDYVIESRAQNGHTTSFTLGFPGLPSSSSSSIFTIILIILWLFWPLDTPIHALKTRLNISLRSTARCLEVSLCNHGAEHRQ